MSKKFGKIAYVKGDKLGLKPDVLDLVKGIFPTPRYPERFWQRKYKHISLAWMDEDTGWLWHEGGCLSGLIVTHYAVVATLSEFAALSKSD